MKIYIIRHGDPDYEHDCLTEKGHAQSILLADRLANIPFDRIYCSTQGRAIQTASYTIKKHNIEPILEDWMTENETGRYYGFVENGSFYWLYNHPVYSKILSSQEVKEMGYEWYNHPAFQKYNIKQGYDIMSKHVDEFLEELGYKLDRTTYKCRRTKDDIPEYIAIFAHEGFTFNFLSNMLGVPYSTFSTMMDRLAHTGYCIIELSGDICAPKFLAYNEHSHIDNL